MSKHLIVIVGAGPGVSQSVAKHFGGKGFRVVLLARRQEALDQYVAELTEQDIEAYSLTADAASSESLKEAFASIKASYGVPEVLVYNAAVIKPGSPLSFTSEQLLEDFSINVGGALTSAQQVIPDLIERKRGALLFTGGGLALHPHPAYTSLAIGKAGIRSLAFSLAQELAPHGIFVGTVTISGTVKKDTFYDPDVIAESYWELYEQRTKTEVVFQQAEK